jgi:tetratricopeptide (TPR) repeat protein
MNKIFPLKRPSPWLLLAVFLAFFVISGCGRTEPASRPNLEKARRLIARGDYTAAFMQLNQALAEAPKDPDVHLNLGWLYLYTDDFPHAREEWLKARALDPDRAEGYHLRGAMLSDQARKLENVDLSQSRQYQEEAVLNFREALRRDAKNDQTYFDLASSLLALNRNREAIDTLDQGFEYIPHQDLETQVDFQLASCSAHARLGMYDEAIADCRQAREFALSPAQKQQVDDMIENMRLMNPSADAPPSE